MAPNMIFVQETVRKSTRLAAWITICFFFWLEASNGISNDLLGLLDVIPAFASCSFHVGIFDPISSTNIFEKFPYNLTSEEKVNETGDWCTSTALEQARKMGFEFDRLVIARSALHYCRGRKTFILNHTNHCEKAFRLFRCVFYHGISFNLTTKGYKEYRRRYETLYPYPKNIVEGEADFGEDIGFPRGNGSTLTLILEDSDPPVAIEY